MGNLLEYLEPNKVRKSCYILTVLCLSMVFAQGCEKGSGNTSKNKEFQLNPVQAVLSDMSEINIPAPFTYVQAGMRADDPPSWKYTTQELRNLHIELLSQYFEGAGLQIGTFETAAGLQNIRDWTAAFKTISQMNDKPFYGMYQLARLPGFHFSDDVNQQPADYRSISLKSDGSYWVRYPTETNVIGVSGQYLDITNLQAVDELIENLARVFARDGSGVPQDECIGDMHGYLYYNEWKLSGTYSSIFSSDPKHHDIVHPEYAPENLKYVRMGSGKTHIQLMTDRDPYYHFLVPPKRAVPLFSEIAAAAFQAYAAENGHPEINTLPADRNEFNEDTYTISLPAHVQFIPLTNTVHWGLWENWVYETWTSFFLRVSKTISLAQLGNENFKGCYYFQLPGWYSIRKRAHEPITFQYYDENMVLQTETTTLADHQYYNSWNHVSHGTDFERVIQSPWIAAFEHETTHSIMVNVPSDFTLQEREDFVNNHDNMRMLFLAQGTLAKKITHENGKLFGAFAKIQHFNKNGEFLSAEQWEEYFTRMIRVLKPDIIGTIAAQKYIDRDRESPHFEPVLYSNMVGIFRDVYPANKESYTADYLSRMGNGVGLIAEYHQGKTFSDLRLERIDSTINFDWESTAPHPSMWHDGFCVRWTGQIEPPVTGTYTFFTQANDGVRLWIDGELLVDDWNDRGSVAENDIVVSLVGGQRYYIKMEFYEQIGKASAKLLWQGPEISKQVVNMGRFYPIYEESPFVNVTYPNGGETWMIGETVDIMWDSNMEWDTVSIFLFKDNQPFQAIAWHTENDGHFPWTVRNTIVPGGGYKMRIYPDSDYSLVDFSDDYFTIEESNLFVRVVSPNGGENWVKGTTVDITWETNWEDTQVSLYLFKDDVPNRAIAWNITNDGHHSYLVQETLPLGGGYKLRLTPSSDTSKKDWSDDYFSVIDPPPFVTVTSPNGGELLPIGETIDITWDSNMTEDTINIFLFKDDEPCQAIAWHTENDGHHSWRVNGNLVVGGGYKMRISPDSDFSLTDFSDDYFNVAEPLQFVRVVSPNGGENWVKGTTVDITWESNMSDSLVSLYLFKDDAPCQAIAWNITNDGHHSYLVRDTLPVGGGYKLRLTPSSNTGLLDWSDSYFTVSE